MKRIIGYRMKVLIAIVTKALEAVFELMMPLMMAKLIDVGIKTKDLTVIRDMSIYILLLTVFGYLASVICQLVSAQVAHRIGYTLRKDVMDKIQTFGEEDYDRYSSSMLVNRLTVDVNNVQEMINRVMRLGFRAPILLIGSVVAMASISGKLAMILLVSLPVFLLIVCVFMYLSLRGHKLVSTQLEALSEKVGESLAGVRIIRAFSKNKEDVQNFQDNNEALMKKQRFVGAVATLSSPFTSLVMNGVLIMLVYISAIEINNGLMTQGQVIAVINYCTQLVLTLIITMNIIMITSKGLVSYKRVNSVLLADVMKNKVNAAEVKSPISLSFDKVSYSYVGEKRKVISDISFDLKPGKVLALVGLTGSGKSTLVRLIPRLMDPTEGSVLINGMNVKDVSLESLRSQIGFISQSAQFVRGTIEENVLMGKSIGDAKQALIHAQGQDVLDKGLLSIVEEGGKNLSGGQRQRINIARALVKNPSILIFDDSFSALDSLTDRNLRDSLKEHYKDCAQIIISQRTQTVIDADEIILLQNGKIVGRGVHEQLLSQSDLYRTIHEIQNKGGSDYVE